LNNFSGLDFDLPSWQWHEGARFLNVKFFAVFILKNAAREPYYKHVQDWPHWGTIYPAIE